MPVTGTEFVLDAETACHAALRNFGTTRYQRPSRPEPRPAAS